MRRVCNPPGVGVRQTNPQDLCSKKGVSETGPSQGHGYKAIATRPQARSRHWECTTGPHLRKNSWGCKRMIEHDAWKSIGNIAVLQFSALYDELTPWASHIHLVGVYHSLWTILQLQSLCEFCIVAKARWNIALLSSNLCQSACTGQAQL